MTEQLEEQLESLSPNDISRFSLAAAETLWLTFKKIYEKEFSGDIAQTDIIFDKAWLLVAGQLKDTTAEQLETMAQDQIPNLDNHMEIFESAWRLHWPLPHKMLPPLYGWLSPDLQKILLTPLSKYWISSVIPLIS
ncbi:DUF416 family protein [Chitinophaga pinensis]|uniref:DUF416 family protein n=1 Tax=Chitinophaga pinensis TaxID=79329 RepID=A0A5C6LSB8_9BACT|nr:DUF416 family protein [Chitinophaga pinensis]TWV99349.1 DUF416 family protein [Chitinophaga pinensis]